MKDPIDSGLLLGSEPLENIRPRGAAAGADDDKSDTKDTDGLDGGEDADGTDADGADSDETDSDGTDGKD